MPNIDMTPKLPGAPVLRRTLKLGLLTALFGLLGRAKAGAADALTIEADGSVIAPKLRLDGSDLRLLAACRS